MGEHFFEDLQEHSKVKRKVWRLRWLRNGEIRTVSVFSKEDAKTVADRIKKEKGITQMTLTKVRTNGTEKELKI